MEAKRSILERLKEVDISTLKKTESFTSEDKGNNSLIKSSIHKHGQIRPVYIDSDGNILEGNKIVLCMLELGHKTVFCIELDCNLKDKIRLFNNLAWSDINYVKLGTYLRHKQDLMDEIPLSGQDFTDFVDFSDFNPDDYKDVKVQVSLFEEDEVVDNQTFEEYQKEKKENPPAVVEQPVLKTEVDEIAPEDLKAAAEKYDEVRKEQAEKFKDIGGISNVAPVIIQEAPKEIVKKESKPKVEVKKPTVDFTKLDAAIEKKDWLLAKFWVNDILGKFPDNEIAIEKQKLINEVSEIKKEVEAPITPVEIKKEAEAVQTEQPEAKTVIEQIKEAVIEAPQVEEDWVVIEDFQSEDNYASIKQLDYLKKSMVNTIMFTGTLTECTEWKKNNPYKEEEVAPVVTEKAPVIEPVINNPAPVVEPVVNLGPPKVDFQYPGLKIEPGENPFKDEIDAL